MLVTLSPLAETRLTDDYASLLEAQTPMQHDDALKALSWCREAITADRACAGHYLFCASLLIDLQRLSEAEATLNQALVCEPELVMAHYLLAVVAQLDGRAADAHAHYRQTLRLLTQFTPADELPNGDGMTAERLTGLISAQMAGLNMTHEAAYGRKAC